MTPISFDYQRKYQLNYKDKLSKEQEIEHLDEVAQAFSTAVRAHYIIQNQKNDNPIDASAIYDEIAGRFEYIRIEDIIRWVEDNCFFVINERSKELLASRYYVGNDRKITKDRFLELFAPDPNINPEEEENQE